MQSVTWSELFTERDGRNYKQFILFLMAAVLSFGAATLLLAENFIERGIGAWLLVATAIVFALLTVRAYVVFLRHADELLQRIHLDGLALGFGMAAAFMPCWRLLERMGAPKLDVNDALIVLMLGWILGINRGLKRYAGGTE